MAMDFIRRHLIVNVQKMIIEKQKFVDFDGFFHLNECTKNRDNIFIDRVNRHNPYIKDKLYASNWYLLESKALLEIYKKIKNNEFYFIKNIKGQDYKFRLKNNILYNNKDK